MFVINFKLNFKKILLVCIVLSLVTAVLVETTYNKSQTVNSTTKYDYILNDENYTTLLKQIHENIDNNIGKTITVSGFVYKQDDFKDDMFVCGRNIIVNEEDSIAGFLCSQIDAKKLNANEWIEVTGIIQKTDYNNTMPIIKVNSITKIKAPNNTFVK